MFSSLGSDSAAVDPLGIFPAPLGECLGSISGEGEEEQQLIDKRGVDTISQVRYHNLWFQMFSSVQDLLILECM